MTSTPRFSSRTIEFLKTAARQKNPNWLDRHQEEYDELIRAPLQHLAKELARELKKDADGYHFPQKGIGRLKRPASRVAEYGGGLFKNYIGYTATRPSQSMFDSNPSLFFMINSDDRDGDEVLLAGGLYMPSSRQLKTIREKIAENAAPFEALFKTKAFAARYPDGFSDERKSSRPPRGFDPNHEKIEWLKLQGFFVWRSYRKKEYSSSEFTKILAADAKQILKLNAILDQALSGRWPELGKKKSDPSVKEAVLERVSGDRVTLHTPDF